MKRIAVTMGDPAGIGGETILKALTHIGKRSIPVIIGELAVVDYLATGVLKDQRPVFKSLRGGQAGDAEFLDLGRLDKVQFGKVAPEYGEAAYRYILEALKLLFLGDVSAVVTCPINKKSLQMAGIQFPGHTELLAHFAGVTDYVMMMASRRLRVCLVTIHVPLKQVPGSISAENVLRCIFLTHTSLKDYFGRKNPSIKVCGLNPHAGEQGVIGDEEEEIRRAVEQARSTGIHVAGPFAADSLFHRIDCDAYIAMYHDQGLIPVKTLDFRRTVNITLGLPFVRVSPGHGTGFDIAGKGVADPAGLIEAYRTAEQMIEADAR